MKTRFHSTLMTALAFTLFASRSAVAQGPLTPPGPPAPTMKTLDQVEARTPISSVPFTITNSGSYYLTGNLTVTNGNGITITANQVTLNLNGFTISSTAPSATGIGILLYPVSDITILNGHIKGAVTETSGTFSGSGFANGIANIPSPVNVRVTGVSVSGCLNSGIDAGYSAYASASVVESCVVRTVGGGGIFAGGVSRCTVFDCGGSGIVANSASDCNAYSIGSSAGITASAAINCYGVSVNGIGIDAKTVANCYGYSTSSQGIRAETASNCRGHSISNRGVFADVAIACIGESEGTSYGLYATLIANTCYGTSDSGTALYAYIAIGCVGFPVSYTYHYNMPPSPVTP